MKKGNELLQQKNNFKEKLSAVILCAGEGTRLRNITKTTPKPLIKIESLNNISILHHNINNLINLEINQIGVVIGYLGDSIRESLLSLEKNNQTIQDKLVIIETENQYKFGPLYSFLSIIRNKDFFTSSRHYLIIPGDTIFNYNLLEEVLTIISYNFDLIHKHPFIFYRAIKLKSLKKLYNRNKIISNAEIEAFGSQVILRRINQEKIREFSSRYVMNQIIPISIFSFEFINKILNLKGTIHFKTVWETLNYMIESGNKVLAFEIKCKQHFYDIDNKVDINNLKKKRGQ